MDMFEVNIEENHSYPRLLGGAVFFQIFAGKLRERPKMSSF